MVLSPVFSSDNLPNGASFADQGDGTAIFHWTPVEGQASTYEINFIASDGVLSTTRQAVIKVNSASDTDGDGMLDDWEREQFGDLERDGLGDADDDGVSDLEEFERGTDPNMPDGPEAPVIIAPILEERVGSKLPQLVVANSTYDGEFDLVYVFEIFADEAYSQLVDAYYSQPEGETETSWQPSTELDEDTTFYWRARSYNGFTYSTWVNGQFFVNSQNSAPNQPVISFPSDGAEIDQLSPVLKVTNATDQDRDILTYEFFVYADDSETVLLSESGFVSEDPSGMTSWQYDQQLVQGEQYYWKVRVTDPDGQKSDSDLAMFSMAILNSAPDVPGILSPIDNGEVANALPELSVTEASDPDGDSLEYLFELDNDTQFISPALQTSGAISGGGNIISWTVPLALQENAQYFWRVKARDPNGAESDWVSASFLVNVENEAPPLPVIKNPGDESWVSTLEPKLEVHPVTDADSDNVNYEFELSDELSISNILQSNNVVDPEFMLQILTDNQWYYWRARAIDEHDLASEWTSVQSFFVNQNDIDDAPVFTWVEPSTNLVVEQGESIEFRWADEDPDSSASIWLYYATDAQGLDKVSITGPINEDGDLGEDSYQWDTTSIEVGTYYLIAEIMDDNTAVSELNTYTVTITLPVTTAEIISPVPGSILPDTTVTFTWEDVDADQYVLDVGTSPGTFDIARVFTPDGSTTQQEISNLPEDGSTVYVRLRTSKNGRNEDVDYEYTAHTYVPETAEITSPTPGSVLPGTTATFVWEDLGADQYVFQAGTSQGSHDIVKVYTQDGSTTQLEVTNLPDDGSTVYVLLQTHKDGRIEQIEYEYTAHTYVPVIAEVTSPIPGSVLPGKIATFIWEDVEADQYVFQAGTSQGSHDIVKVYTQDGSTTQLEVTNLPDDGSTVYVLLQTHKDGRIEQIEYEYTAHTYVPVIAEVTSPTPGSVLPGKIATFIWEDVEADQYVFQAGTSQGSHDIVKVYTQDGSTTQLEVTNLPDDGSTVYVLLQTHKDGRIEQIEYEYTAHTYVPEVAEITSPTPGSVLPGTTATFVWEDLDADQYHLRIGTTEGAFDIGSFSSNDGQATQAEISGLPNDGSTVHVQL